jgi:hypothetical protein
MEETSTAELIKDWQTGAIIVFACLAAGIIGASLLRGLPAGMSIGFVIGVIVTFLGISFIIGRD